VTGKELAAAAWAALAPKTDADFARRLGLTGDYRSKRVRRWLDGTNEPDYEGTVTMLRAAGLLREEAVAAVASSGPGRGSVEDGLLELKVQLAEGLRNLSERLAELETQRTVASPRAQPRKRRAS
jgi:hypothetical protein